MKPTPEKQNIHPLARDYLDHDADAALVRAAVQGDRAALETLVRRHQGFIHSLAQRMLYTPEDAADATQEILIRIVTNLAAFRGEAAFRTWAYAIAVRQLFAFRKGQVEHVVHDFACFAQCLDQTPDLDLPDGGGLPVDVQLVVEEAKVGCLMAMLLCLDREHRMAFVLGEIFEASDAVAAEVLGISEAVVCSPRAALVAARARRRDSSARALSIPPGCASPMCT
jgi:RNA polymerase sigma factor (sigma-70 family)